MTRPSRRPLRRPRLSLGLVLVLLTGCTVTVPTSTSQAPSVPSTQDGGESTVPSTSTVRWHDCDDGFECGTVAVPLDWDDPGGTTIDLSLIRMPAREADPVGSLVFNPGGPGAPGTTFLRQFLDSGNFPDELADRFDLVSWDPRGTGGSAGIACLEDDDMLAPDPLPYPPTAAARDEAEATAARQLRTCEDSDGDVIPHVGTKATVRDLDAIREAVGDAGLNYVGFSYGTTIGLEYLATYGDRVRAMVLDGVALPGTDPVATTRAQMSSFEDNLGLFLDDCAADSSCSFGDGDPHKALMALLDDLAEGTRLPASYVLPDESGTTHRRDGTLGYTEAVTGIAAALYSRSSWVMLRVALAEATDATDPEGHTLLMLRDLLRGRQLDGTWDHSTEANAAINCADQAERATSLFGDPARIRAWSVELPVFGAFGATGLPGCYEWPDAVEPLEALTKADLAAAPQVVVVNSAHDPATPYANAVAAAAMLPDARLVTWGGSDHTSFGGGHGCIDDAVVPYLIDGKLPATGLRCPDDG